MLSRLLKERECIDAAASDNDNKEQRVHLVSLSSCLPKVTECLGTAEADGLKSMTEVFGWNILNLAEGCREGGGENDARRSNNYGGDGGGGGNEEAESLRQMVEMERAKTEKVRGIEF